MEPLVVVCEGCGVRARTSRPESARARRCPCCGRSLAEAVDRACLVIREIPESENRSRGPGKLTRALSIAPLLISATLLGLASTAVLPNRSVPTDSRPGNPRPGTVVAKAAAAVGHDMEARPIERVPSPTDPPRSGARLSEHPDAAAWSVRMAIAVDPEIGRPHDLLGVDLPSQTRAPDSTKDSSPSTKIAAKPAEGPEQVRLLVRDRRDRPVTARLYAMEGDHPVVFLPDGSIGFPDAMIKTDKPFEPVSKNQLRSELLSNEFPQFRVKETKHYLILYQGTTKFAESSAELLENLFDGLVSAFEKRGFDVHDAEFPLVAIIFHTEQDFRAYRQVAPDVQAYYDVISNRIHLYEKSAKDAASPEVAALRKPQTVAHEGTHQILQNIGIQPRLSAWPIWLIEGLAEYCASPKSTKKGPTWGGLGLVNSIHMATIRDLEDPLSTAIRGRQENRIGRDPKIPLVEHLVTRKELTPTDYALSWAMTHYLANQRLNAFINYLKDVSKLPPFQAVTPEEHLAMFRNAFGADLSKMDGRISNYLGKLKNYDALPFYAVMVEQPLPDGRIRRSALVSQSPSVVQQWLHSSSTPRSGSPRWRILPHPTRARAVITAEQFLNY